jgi:hypothetical protein
MSGGRNAERGMIALRVQDPAARHEEASNDSSVFAPSGRRVCPDFSSASYRSSWGYGTTMSAK